MKREIKVKVLAEDAEGRVFKVSVCKEKDATEHIVSLTEETFKKLGEGRSEEDLIKRSFEFLLEREEKGCLLKSFDISEITNRFPEFEKEILN